MSSILLLPTIICQLVREILHRSLFLGLFLQYCVSYPACIQMNIFLAFLGFCVHSSASSLGYSLSWGEGWCICFYDYFSGYSMSQQQQIFHHQQQQQQQFNQMWVLWNYNWYQNIFGLSSLSLCGNSTFVNKLFYCRLSRFPPDVQQKIQQETDGNKRNNLIKHYYVS